MDNKIKKNYIYNLASQLLTIIIPIITTPYISRVLGAQAIGDFSYTTGIVSYFCMVAMLGTANYAQREIAKKHESKMYVSYIFYEIVIIRIIMILMVLGCYLVFLNLPMWRQYRILFSVQIISFVAWGFDITWFYQGLEQFKITATRNTIIKLISTIFIFLIVKKESDLVLYTIIYCASDLIGNITMWPYLKKNIVKVERTKINVFRHIKGTLELFVPNIALQLYTVFDKTMLGYMVDTLQVGYYSQAEKIIKIILVAISSLFTVLLPRFAYLNDKGNDVEANKYFISAVEYTYFLAIPMTIGCIYISDYFVPLFFGRGYEAVSPLMKILSILFIVMSVEKLLGTILIAYNRQNAYTVSVVIASIINILLNAFFICIMRWNAVGVAIASVTAEVVALLVQIRNLPENFQKKNLVKPIKNYLIAGFGMLLILIAINLFAMGNLLHLIFDIVMGSVVYFGILSLLNDKMIKSLFVNVKNIINSIRKYR